MESNQTIKSKETNTYIFKLYIIHLLIRRGVSVKKKKKRKVYRVGIEWMFVVESVSFFTILSFISPKVIACGDYDLRNVRFLRKLRFLLLLVLLKKK